MSFAAVGTRLGALCFVVRLHWLSACTVEVNAVWPVVTVPPQGLPTVLGVYLPMAALGLARRSQSVFMRYVHHIY
jgi:hypothetical protein